MTLAGLNDGYKKTKVLRNGKPGKARVLDLTPTGVSSNNRPEYKVTYKYKADNGREYKFDYKTYDVHEVTDEEYEVIFYDAHHPDQGMPYDDLASIIKINRRGELEGHKPFIGFLKLIFVCICYFWPIIWFLLIG